MTISRPHWLIFKLAIGFLLAGALTSGGMIAYPRQLDVKWPVPRVPMLHDHYGDKLAAVERTIVLNRAVACLPYKELIARTAYYAGLDAAEWASLIIVESSCNPLAISNQGAVGLAQVHLKSWQTVYNFENMAIFDPAVNLRVGSHILLQYKQKYGSLALRYYHGIASDGRHERYEKTVTRGTGQ